MLCGSSCSCLVVANRLKFAKYGSCLTTARALSLAIRARLLLVASTTRLSRTTLLLTMGREPVQERQGRRDDDPPQLQGRAPLAVAVRVDDLPVSLVGDVVVGRDGDD